MTGSLQVEETSAYCTVNHQASASNQHEAPGPRYEPAASEVGGKNSNHHSTKPPGYDTKNPCNFQNIKVNCQQNNYRQN